MDARPATSSDPINDPRSTAIDVLEELGLSTYAARTYVALASLGTATATDVSDVADVPRTRVYDAADELADHGLVDVLQSSPKEFRAVSAETTGRKFEAAYRHRTMRLRDALSDLEPTERRDEQRGVWTVTGWEAVTDRTVEFLEDADEEIVYMTVDEVLTDRVMAALEDAADRSVTIKLGGGPAGRSETAIWGAGEANSLVVVLKGIFAWRLEEAPDE